MIKTLQLFSFLLLLLSSHAQVKTATIVGTSDTVLSMTLGRVTQNGVLHVIDTIRLGANNTFKQKVTIDNPTLAQLVLNKKPIKAYWLWLLPGSVLRVEFKKDNIAFTGLGSNFANYYKKKDSIIIGYIKDYTFRHPDFRDNANSLISYTDSIKGQQELFLESYFSKGERATQQVKQFLQLERVSVLYSNLYYKLNYDDSVYERFKLAQHGSKSDKAAYKYSEKIDFENVNLLSNQYYQSFAVQFVADIALKKQKAGGKPFDIEPYVDIAMQTVDELTNKDVIAIEIKAMLLNKIIEEISRERKDKWIPKVQATLKTLLEKEENERLELLQIKLTNIIANTRFKKGNPAPDFVLTDSVGRKYSLKDFKGKKILMDIGASWCKPCIQSIPSWNVLAESNSGNNNLVFISLSLDNSIDTWKKWLKHKPKGLLLNANLKGFESDFANAYSVTALPKLMIIDEEGKIDEYNAPAADSKEILKMLKLEK